MDPSPSSTPPEPMGESRRVFNRAQLEVEVTIGSDDNFYNGFTENVSEGGIFVATHVPLAVGNNVDVEFSLPNVPRKVRVHCTVCWVRPYREDGDAPPGMGLRFLEITAEDAALVTAFIRHREPIFYD